MGGGADRGAGGAGVCHAWFGPGRDAYTRVGALLAGRCAVTLVAAALSAPPRPGPGPEALRVRVIQANAAQHLKWRSDMIPVFWERRIELTSAPADRPPDIVGWPEVSLPYLAGSNREADEAIAAAAGGALVLAGAQRRSPDARLFNSLVAIDADGEIAEIYDKHHLAPFAEYFPGGALARRLGLTGLATDALGAFTPGPGPEVLDLGRLGSAALPALSSISTSPGCALWSRGCPWCALPIPASRR